MRISVIIPTYNYASCIKDAIDSVYQAIEKARVYEYEVIVLDDGSEDNTEQLIRDMIKDDYPSLVYFRIANSGKAAATAEAIRISNGDIIFNLDADDVFLPDKFKYVLDIYKKHPEVVHVAHPALCRNVLSSIDSVESFPTVILNKVLDGNSVLRFFLSNNILYGGGSTFSVRKSALRYLDHWAASDMYCDEMLSFLALTGGKCFYLDFPLSVWNIHGSNYSVGSVDKSLSKLKQNRLLKSSEGLLKLINIITPNEIEINRLYRFKHAVRQAYDAQLQCEIRRWLLGLFSILHLLSLISIRRISLLYQLTVKYHIFYRIIPPVLYLLLKRKQNN